MIDLNYVSYSRQMGLKPVFKGEVKSPDVKVRHEFLLNEEFVADVKSGKKQSTIRKGYNFVDSPKITIIPEKSAKFDVDFKKLEIVKYGELTEEHAKMDGFRSLHELKTTLDKIYPGMKDDDILTRIVFEYNN